jgi:hypothetical protein
LDFPETRQIRQCYGIAHTPISFKTLAIPELSFCVILMRRKLEIIGRHCLNQLEDSDRMQDNIHIGTDIAKIMLTLGNKEPVPRCYMNE